MKIFLLLGRINKKGGAVNKGVGLLTELSQMASHRPRRGRM